MMGYKAFHSATATIDGIETAHRIQKGQLSEENMSAYKQSMALAGQFYPPISATLHAYEYFRQNLYLYHQILRRIKSLGSTAGCGKPNVRRCVRDNGRNPAISPPRSET